MVLWRMAEVQSWGVILNLNTEVRKQGSDGAGTAEDLCVPVRRKD